MKSNSRAFPLRSYENQRWETTWVQVQARLRPFPDPSASSLLSPTGLPLPLESAGCSLRFRGARSNAAVGQRCRDRDAHSRQRSWGSLLPKQPLLSSLWHTVNRKEAPLDINSNKLFQGFSCHSSHMFIYAVVDVGEGRSIWETGGSHLTSLAVSH